jgi:HK97 gp10 family phage protein
MPLTSWRGEEIVAELVAASEAAVDTAAARAAAYARDHHQWQSRTGEAEAEIFADNAKMDAGKITAEFGDTSDHALYLEVGTVHMEPRPFLRPALDAVSQELAPLIRDEYRA